MKTLPAFFLSVALLAGTARAELPVLFTDDFSKGADHWEPTDPKAWKIAKLDDGNAVFENLGGSKYEPPHRSPFNIALLKDIIVGDFVLTARVMTTKKAYGHRDMCLFFGYQDPAHFYYIHLGEKKDDHANQIFIVNDAPRIKISEKATDGTPWKDGTWHEVKLVREAGSGLIEVYFDDMETPTHVAHDKNFTWGRIGIGTFDDQGMWDDIELRGVKVVPSRNSAAAGPPDPEVLKFTKWTPDFQVPDPVAISFDDQGNAYVTQTRRRKSQDLDIRNNRDWIPDDVGFASVEEKRAFYLERLSPDRSDENKQRVEDLNGDGSHDYRDLTVLSERIYRIEDTDRDGLADEMGVFAEGFQTEITGIAAGVLWHEGDVYATIAPDVWKLHDSTGDGKADHREVFAHGFGLHIAYAGHDMHGLTVGPDGRIYWSIGDKGVRVKSQEGHDWRYPNHGAVLRCEPDGSRFEVFAHGLRNVQELAFDAHGNLFGVDNDADKPGEMERFVYIVNHMDAGWRANWQYREPDYNPWTDEMLWQPYQKDQPAYLTPPISNYMNGPAGFVWNPGTALGPAYDDFFFLTSAPNGQQWAFQAKESGASFEMVNDHQIGNGIPLVGLSFGPDGGLYGVDWGGGYPLNEQGAVWRIDIPGEEKSERRLDTGMMLRVDFPGAVEKNLVKWLGHSDQRVRVKAQFELAKRKKADVFAAVASDEKSPPLARLHAIWGLGQLTRYRSDADFSPLVKLLRDADPEIRAQAAKMIGDGFAASVALSPAVFPTQEGRVGDRTLLSSPLVPLLGDKNARVKFFAAIALGNLGVPAHADAIVEMLEDVKPEETYLRHAGIVGLTGCGETAMLAGLSDHESELVRAAAVVALRRREDPAVAVFLDDRSAWVAAEAARAIHDDWSIPSALPELAAAVETTKHRDNVPLMQRALNANFRLGGEDEAARVVAFAANADAEEDLRREAFDALENWVEPAVLDRVEGRHRPIGERDPRLVARALSTKLDTLLVDVNQDIQRLSMALAGDLEVEIPAQLLAAMFENSRSPESLRSQALRSLASVEFSGLGELIDSALREKSASILIAALDVLTATDPDRARDEISRLLTKKSPSPLTVSQHAVALLPKVGGGSILASLLSTWDQVPAGMRLDLVEVATHPDFADDTEVAAAWAEVNRRLTAEAASGDPVAAFAICLEGGDPTEGENIVRNNVTAQCIACHKLEDGKGSTVGPNLKDVAKKGRDYLLESLANPQAVITEGYGMITLTLNSGDTVAGQFRGEKGGVIELRDPEGKVTKVKSAEVKERSPVISTMPPIALILSKREVRDVVAYLATLKVEK